MCQYGMKSLTDTGHLPLQPEEQSVGEGADLALPELVAQGGQTRYEGLGWWWHGLEILVRHAVIENTIKHLQATTALWYSDSNAASH